MLKGHGSIAAAWRAYEVVVLAANAPPFQRTEIRLAFFAGAAALFYGLQALDPGEEPTDADFARLDAIYAEINAFARTFDAEIKKRHGGQQ